MNTTTTGSRTDGLSIEPEQVCMLLDACPEGMLMTDLDGNIVAANKSASGKLCGRLESPLGRNLYRDVPPELADSMKSYAFEVINTRSTIHFVGEWSGSRMGIDISPILDREGRLGWLAWFCKILHDDEELSRVFELRGELTRSLMDHLPDYFFIKDSESRFIISNASHLQVMGLERLEEVSGKTDFDNFPREFAEQYFADEQRVVRTGVPLINKEEEVIDYRGNRKWLLTTKLPLRNKNGTIVGIFGISRDISDLKRVERELRDAREELEARVQNRTAELASAIEELRNEIAERKRVETELRSSEEKFRTLFEESKDVVFMSSPEGKFLDINRAGVELYAYGSKEELLTIDVTTDLYVNPEDRKQFQAELARKGYVKDFEMMLKRKDGQTLVVLESAVAVRDEHGKAVAYQGITHDITEQKKAVEALREAHAKLESRVRERTSELALTNEMLMMEISERKRVEDELRESEERYRTLFEESRDAIYITRRSGEIIEMNQYALDQFGYRREEILGNNVDILYVYPRDRFRFQEEIEEKGFVRDFEVKLRTKDGTELDCLITSTIRCSKNKDILGYQGIIRDITERKRADAELRSSRQTLREFSARLQAVREEEKHRISGEIHDELGQILTGLKLDLSWLRTKLRRARTSNSIQYYQQSYDPIMEKLQSMILLTNRTIQTVRRIARELRPTILDHLGLLETMEWQAHEFETHTMIRCKVSSNFQDTGLLDQGQATAAFRIFQEALTNVARHAQATKVHVSLMCSDDVLILKVEDNGRGINPSEIYGAPSLGLLGMRERAMFLGGDLAIVGTPQKGTSVTVRIPLGKRAV
jgi:PAS domain S-box-containing protein